MIKVKDSEAKLADYQKRPKLVRIMFCENDFIYILSKAGLSVSKYCHQAAMDNHILFCFIVLFYVLFKTSHHLHEADIHIWYR